MIYAFLIFHIFCSIMYFCWGNLNLYGFDIFSVMFLRTVPYECSVWVIFFPEMALLSLWDHRCATKSRNQEEANCCQHFCMKLLVTRETIVEFYRGISKNLTLFLIKKMCHSSAQKKSLCCVINGGRDKMGVVLQTFSNLFYWMKNSEFRSKWQWN